MRKAGRADLPPGGAVDGGSTAAQAFDGDQARKMALVALQESQKKLQTLPDADPVKPRVHSSSSKDDAVKKDAPDKKKVAAWATGCTVDVLTNVKKDNTDCLKLIVQGLRTLSVQ